MLSPRQLEQFGLNEKEAKVYLAALQLGASSVQNIAQLANIHRVSTYDILEALKEKGYIHETTEGAKRVVVPADPETMMDSIRKKERVFADLMPELKALQGKKGGKPRVLYFEGRDQVWQAFFDCLKQSNTDEPHLIFGTLSKAEQLYPEEFKKIINKQIKDLPLKIISEPSKQTSLTWSKNQAIKFVAPTKEFKNNVIIFSNSVLTISWENMVAIIVEDNINADNQRFIFNMLWDYMP